MPLVHPLTHSVRCVWAGVLWGNISCYHSHSLNMQLETTALLWWHKISKQQNMLFYLMGVTISQLIKWLSSLPIVWIRKLRTLGCSLLVRQVAIILWQSPSGLWLMKHFEGESASISEFHWIWWWHCLHNGWQKQKHLEWTRKMWPYLICLRCPCHIHLFVFCVGCKQV